MIIDDTLGNKNVKGIVAASEQPDEYDGVSSEGSDSVNVKRINALEQKVENLEDKYSDLEGKARELNNNFEKTEKNQNKALGFMYFVASAIMVAFFLAAIPIFFDYFLNNYTRNEKFIEKINEVEAKYYTKQDLNLILENQNNEQQTTVDNLKKNLDDLKNFQISNLERENIRLLIIFECLKTKRYWQFEHCLK